MEPHMPRYTATFSKIVSNDTGHERKICQREFVVEAKSRAAAAAAAKEQFCALQGVPNWCFHADELSLRREPLTRRSEQAVPRSDAPGAPSRDTIGR
jgi:hypothetical protein